jgi:hypothetical protein
MIRTPARPAPWALVIGAVVATAGYAAAFAANGSGDGRYTGSSWTPLYTIALLGDVIVVLGLPALLQAHGERARRLTLIGYVGVLVPLVILNVGEGCIEAFAKPYFATHGGLLADDLPGLGAFEAPALVVLLIGVPCLAVAVFRARVLPRWVGAVLLVVPLLGAAGLSGAVSLLPDYLLFVALFAVGVHVLRAPEQHVDEAARVPAPAAMAGK